MFQTSTPLSNLVVVADEPKSCLGTQTTVDSDYIRHVF